MATVVLAELAGSTSLFERLGDDIARSIGTQWVGTLSKIFGRQHGQLVKVLGDGLFVVFQEEGDAPTACIRAQNHPHEQQI